eukprot:326208-Amphidinium_carterae.1
MQDRTSRLVFRCHEDERRAFEIRLRVLWWLECTVRRCYAVEGQVHCEAFSCRHAAKQGLACRCQSAQLFNLSVANLVRCSVS